MIIKFHFYKGLSWVSKIIKWRTRGIYSHVAIEIENNVYEAWEKCGVVKAKNTLENHKPKTPIDTVIVQTEQSVIQKFQAFLEKQVGKKYDWRAILSFAGWANRQNTGKWFCSELANMFFFFEDKKLFSRDLVSPHRFFERLKYYKMGKDGNC